MDKVYALTGGIGTGKSTVAKILSEKGAFISDMDKIAHQIVEPDMPAYNDIVKWIGNDILLKDRRIDRNKLAKIVFNNRENRKKLETITHPRIIQHAQKEITNAIKNSAALVVVDVPLLYEVRLDKFFNPVILVVCDLQIRIDRIKQRDGWTEEEIIARINSQMSIEEKMKKADYIIYNNNDFTELKTQVENLWKILVH